MNKFKDACKKIFPRLLRHAVEFLCLFAVLTIVFFVLITAAYAVPQSKIDANLQASRALLEASDSLNPQLPFGKGILMDYYTDKLMLTLAEREEGVGVIRTAQVEHYARYWHGYQVYLRPALALGNLQDLRWVNTLVQYAAICLLAALLAKRLHPVFAVCFGASLALVDYLVVPYSFQFSGVFLVMLAASIALLALCEKPWFQARMPQFFFITGAVTVFTDLLTAPVITLGVPLALLLLLRARGKNEHPLRSFLALIGNGVAWAAGYVALWFSKWLMASVVLHRNEILISLRQILFRTGTSADGYIYISMGENADLQTWGDYENLDRFAAFRSAIETWMELNWLSLFVAAVLAASLVACLLSRRARNAIPDAAPLLAVALIAPLWLLLLGQHTAIHNWFTYRNLLPTGFALLCLPCCFWLQVKKKEKEKDPS
ncbi:MAG: hypothetical protein LBS96_10110 [Oscillospiraceae bacterium]|nr:hypothetical protein [Oscillospiraceae bacterium]